MVSHFKVRFASSKQQFKPDKDPCIHYHSQAEQAKAQWEQPTARSKTGCRECRNRKVKCDEAYPVCRRCERRGAVCRSMPRIAKWQVEIPWLSTSLGPHNSPLFGISNVNQRLLRIWLEKGCHMMPIDPEDNPMSFPIIQHLPKSPSLVHTLQSVSAGYECHFEGKEMVLCLEERQRALLLLRDELEHKPHPSPSVFLSILLLGCSSPWIDQDFCTFGREHLVGARGIIDSIITDANKVDKSIHDPTLRFIVGCYIYWDMCCSILAPPSELPSLDQPHLLRYVQEMRNSYHAVAGFSTELFYLLGKLGRYCRQVLDTGQHDFSKETAFEKQLTDYTNPSGVKSRHLALVSYCYRNHGLMLLFRICGRWNRSEFDFPHRDSGYDGSGYRPNLLAKFNSDSSLTEQSPVADADKIIRQLAIDTVENISEIPLNSQILNTLALPILTAGSELDAIDYHERKECITRFNSLYSRNRCPSYLWACQFLETLWEERDFTKVKLAWPVVSRRNRWTFSLV